MESTLNRQSVATNKVAISTSTTTLGSGQYDEKGFTIPETKAKRAGRGRGKKSDTSGETKTATSRRNRSRGPAIEIDFTDDKDYSLSRNNSGTQLESDRETESLNRFSSLLNAQTNTLKSTFREELSTLISDAVDSIESRIDARLQRFETANNAQFQSMDSRLTNLEQTNNNLPKVLELAAANVKELDQNIAEMDRRMEAHANTVSENGFPNHNFAESKAFTDMSTNVDRIDQNSLNSTLIISGLNSNSQTKERIEAFCREILGVAVLPSEITAVANLGFNKDGYSITKVSFLNVDAKICVYKGRVNLRGN